LSVSKRHPKAWKAERETSSKEKKLHAFGWLSGLARITSRREVAQLLSKSPLITNALFFRTCDKSAEQIQSALLTLKASDTFQPNTPGIIFCSLLMNFSPLHTTS